MDSWSGRYTHFVCVGFDMRNENGISGEICGFVGFFEDPGCGGAQRDVQPPSSRPAFFGRRVRRDQRDTKDASWSALTPVAE